MSPGANHSVDVLSEPEKVADINELDPKRFVIVAARRTGLLLPDPEGVAMWKSNYLLQTKVRIFRRAGRDLPF